MNDPDDTDDYLPSAQRNFQNYSQSTTQRSQNGASTNQRPHTHTHSYTASSSQRPSQGPSSQRSQNHGASASQWSQNHGASTSQNDRETQIAEITQGMNYLRERLEDLTKGNPGQVKIKEDKKNSPKPKEKLPCKLCNKVLANKTNLFRHYRGIHAEFNPERFLGYTVNDTIHNIEDTSFQEHRCGICGYVAGDKNSLDAHTVVVHSNDIRELCRVCGYKASSKDDLDNHSRMHTDANSGSVNNVNAGASTSANVINNARVTETIKDKMHKCDDCSCYFDDKSKFDEHMKVQHGLEVLCKICNKNFRFKDFERHVKDTHPDVFDKKDESVRKKGNVIVESVVRTKSGRIEIVFKCTKCSSKFSNRREARRHAMIHKKEFRTKVVASNEDAIENADVEELPADEDIIYVCEACDTATASYDVVVEHSQKHLTNPNTKIITTTCDICDIKFEPICYEKHIDVHYRNKEIDKESFKFLRYKYNLLLSNDWFGFFNMADEVVKKIVDRSIYANTRSVKMRVVSVSGTTPYNVNLYQCSQCDNFVEPSAVTNHTLNFDTCVKIRNSFSCNVCQRSFNTQIARDNHEMVHNGNESFRIVMFNNERDKEFNRLLNDPNTVPSDLNRLETGAANTNNDPNEPKDDKVEKVIYKCLCGLCFVYMESALDHTKICPGSEPKQSCQKCNHLFNIHELVTHCFEHHINEKLSLIIKNIIPDAIMVESDDDSEDKKCMDEIIVLSSDDEDEQNQTDKAKYLPHTAGRNNVLDSGKENEPQNSVNVNVTPVNGSVAEDSNVQAKALLVATVTTTQNEDISTDEYSLDEPNNDQNSGHSNHGITEDDDSLDSVTGTEYTGLVKYTNNNVYNVKDVDKRNNEIKCVETNRLINPFHIRNNLYNSVTDAGEINRQVATEIEHMTRKIAGTNEINIIKEEIPWYLDENEVPNVFWRPSLRQLGMSNVTSTDNTVVVVEDILTDDEDVEMAPVSEQADNIQEHSNSANSSGSIMAIRSHTEYHESNEEIAPNDNNVVFNVNVNVQTNNFFRTNIVSNPLNEERYIKFQNNVTTVDVFRPSARNGIKQNKVKSEAAVLSENHTVINTDNIKLEDETKLKTEIEHYVDMDGCDDVDIEQVVSTQPNRSDAMLPYGNVINDIENRLVVNNLEVQVSGQNVIMKPNCVIS